MKKKDVKQSDCVIVAIRFVPLERVSIVLQKQSTPNQALIIFLIPPNFSLYRSGLL